MNYWLIMNSDSDLSGMCWVCANCEATYGGYEGGRCRDENPGHIGSFARVKT